MIALLFFYLFHLAGHRGNCWYFYETHFLLLLTQKQVKIRVNLVSDRWEGFAVLWRNCCFG